MQVNYFPGLLKLTTGVFTSLQSIGSPRYGWFRKFRVFCQQMPLLSWAPNLSDIQHCGLNTTGRATSCQTDIVINNRTKMGPHNPGIASHLGVMKGTGRAQGHSSNGPALSVILSHISIKPHSRCCLHIQSLGRKYPVVYIWKRWRSNAGPPQMSGL